MRKNTKILTVAVLTVGLATGAVTYAKSKFTDPEAKAAFVVKYVADELNLDTTQTQNLEALKNQVVTTALSMRSEFSPVKDEIQTLVSAESFDQARVLELVNARTSAVDAAAPEIINALGVFLDGLDAEQKSKVLEFIEHRDMHKKHHKRGWLGRGQ